VQQGLEQVFGLAQCLALNRPQTLVMRQHRGELYSASNRRYQRQVFESTSKNSVSLKA
jgi:hypothetical protein